MPNSFDLEGDAEAAYSACTQDAGLKRRILHVYALLSPRRLVFLLAKSCGFSSAAENSGVYYQAREGFMGKQVCS